MKASDTAQLKLRMRLLLNISGALIAAVFVPLFWGNTLDNVVSDLFFQIRGPLAEQHDIIIVGVDDHSFSNLQLKWPWPRRLHARLMDSISSARVIVFDILFDTKDMKADDSQFAQAIADHPGVILSTARIVKEHKEYITELWLDPVQPLLEAPKHIGTIELPVDEDGVVRRARRQIGGRISLGYLAAKEFAGGELDFINNEFSINYMGPAGTIRTVPYYEALERPQSSAADPFKDKLVFVGTTSEIGNNPNLPDRFRTPFSIAGTTTPGVEIHANVASNLIAHTAVQQIPVVTARVLGVSLAFLCGLLFFKLQITRSAFIFLLVITVLLVSGYLLFSGASLYVQMATLTVPLVAVFLVSLMTHYYVTFQNEKQTRLLLDESEKRISEILASASIGTGEFEAKPIKVFLSYSHKSVDASYMAEILEFLKGLKTENIEFWSDQNIVEGDKWEHEIEQRLANSDIAVTLVSQSYLDSEYCNTEVNAFLERSVAIVPVIISPCEWNRHTWLSERQFIPSGGETIAEHYLDSGKRDRVYLEIRQALRTHAERLQSKTL